MKPGAQPPGGVPEQPTGAGGGKVLDVDSEPRNLDEARFRTVLGHFPSGLVVVAAAGAHGPQGFTCQSFMSVSLDPPLVAFAPSRSSRTWEAIWGAGTFTVNVLGEDQEDLCRVFAGSGRSKFEGVGWRPARSGAPLLEGAVGWLDCRLWSASEAGDHWVVLGEVVDLGVVSGARPLVFFRGGYTGLRL
jgi:3-hydroxy-9,10-secoandrosta-1,3,5(10)-triene-9,17-dione monooxygenase reductase component